MARKKKPEQTAMRGAGYERPKVPEVQAAAEALRTVREERMALTEDETKRATELLDVMRRNNLTTYTYVDESGVERHAKREPGEEKVTVRKAAGKKGSQAAADADAGN